MFVAQSVHFVVSFLKTIAVQTTLWNSKKGYTSSSWNFQLYCIISIPPTGALKPPNQLPVKLVSGTVSPRVKRLENETDRLSPSSAEIKNAWSYPTTSPYVVMLWCLTEHRGRAWCTVWRWMNLCLERGATKVSERRIFWYRVALFLGTSYSVLNILHLLLLLLLLLLLSSSSSSSSSGNTVRCGPLFSIKPSSITDGLWPLSPCF